MRPEDVIIGQEVKVITGPKLTNFIGRVVGVDGLFKQHVWVNFAGFTDVIHSLHLEPTSYVMEHVANDLIKHYGKDQETCAGDVREEGEICLLWHICPDPTA